MAKTQTTIRKAQASDAESIAGILSETGWFPSFEAMGIERQLEQIRAIIAEPEARGVILVAEDAQAGVVGYASLKWLGYCFLPGPDAYLSELFVTSGRRGKGVGSLLLAEVERLAREKGAARLSLLNRRSRESYKTGFYAKRGWLERKQVANFKLPLKK